jgi:hypothetical protein
MLKLECGSARARKPANARRFYLPPCRVYCQAFDSKAYDS